MFFPSPRPMWMHRQPCRGGSVAGTLRCPRKKYGGALRQRPPRAHGATCGRILNQKKKEQQSNQKYSTTSKSKPKASQSIPKQPHATQSNHKHLKTTQCNPKQPKAATDAPQAMTGHRDIFERSSLENHESRLSFAGRRHGRRPLNAAALLWDSR